jgi:hypothetical protein
VLHERFVNILHMNTDREGVAAEFEPFQPQSGSAVPKRAWRKCPSRFGRIVGNPEVGPVKRRYRKLRKLELCDRTFRNPDVAGGW